MERWKIIPGFPMYAASDHGRVWSLHRNIERAPQIDKNGYMRVSLHHNKKEEKIGVHRLVLLAFAGEPPAGFECHHKNGIKSDNRLENISWVSRKNHYRNGSELMAVHGYTGNVGVSNPNATMTESDVKRILGMRADGASYKEICKTVGVGAGAVYCILSGRTWKHVPRRR